MKFSSEISFLQKILNKQRIPCHLLQNSQNTSLEFDLGIRKFLNSSTSYDVLCKSIMKYIRPNTIFQIQDEFFCQYYLLALPDSSTDMKSILLIGPYVGTEITDTMVLELAEHLKLETTILNSLKNYYSNLTVMTDETWFFSVLSTFGEIIWNGLDNFCIENATEPMSDKMPLITVCPAHCETEEPFITMKALEERYALENNFMKAVSQGLTQKALTVIAKSSYSSLENRLRDPVRDLKNYSIVLNTLLRKAAEVGGVHPLHIDTLSSRYARKIELIVSINEGYALQKEMIYKYCLLVRNHSIHGYSPPVQRVLTRVDMDLTADLSLRTHAKLLNVNPNYLSTTIYLWLISLTASKELSILLLKLYNDGAIGISASFLGLRVRKVD